MLAVAGSATPASLSDEISPIPRLTVPVRPVATAASLSIASSPPASASTRTRPFAVFGNSTA